MRGQSKVESGRDRRRFARDAGMGQFSLISVLAGALVAFASFAVLLAIVAGVLAAVGIDTARLTSNDYRRLGIGSAALAGLVLFISYFFGGYIAGRLARRAGALNGGLVLVVAIVIGAAVALAVGTQADTEAVATDLRNLGVPTSGSDFGDIATLAGVVSLVAMLAGAVLGGIKGERWHGKLTARALSPDVGPEAAARHEADEAQQRRVDADTDRPWANTWTASTTAQPEPVADPSDASGTVPVAPIDRAASTSVSPDSGGGAITTAERPARPRRDRPLRSPER